MNETPTPTGRRIDRDHFETSPSTGSEETAVIMHAPGAHALEEDPDLESSIMFTEMSPTLEVAQ